MSEKNLTTDATKIIDELLKAVGLNAPTFAKRIGVGYQRIFDLQRGRVKKFHPEIVKAVCKEWPQVNANYLYTGDGSLFLTPGDPMDMSVEEMVENAVRAYMESETVRAKIKELEERAQRVDKRETMLANREDKVTEMLASITARDKEIQERQKQLCDLEHSLMERELALLRREKELEIEILKNGGNPK